MSKFLLYFILLIAPNICLSQKTPCETNLENGWCWGNNTIIAKKHYHTLDSLAKENLYVEALPHLEWLLKNTPNLHKALYIYGEKTYCYLADEQGELFAHKLLGLIDQRMNVFGDPKHKLLQKKGLLAFHYLYPLSTTDTSYYDTLYTLHSDIFELAGAEITKSDLAYYYAIIAHEQHKRGKIDADSLSNVRAKIAEIIDGKIKEYEDAELQCQKWKKTAGFIHEQFPFHPEARINYEFIQEKWADKILTHKDIAVARKALRHLIKLRMLDSLLFMQSLQLIHEAKPKFSTALVLYRWHTNNLSPISSVTKYRNECIGLAQSRLDSAKSYDMMGDEARMANDYQLARIHYLNAISLMGQSGKSIYAKIAELYLASIHRCVEDLDVENNQDLWAIYLAAYDMYAMAGDKEGMAKAREHFPTKADIFLYLHGSKETIIAPCWIGDEVVIRAK